MASLYPFNLGRFTVDRSSVCYLEGFGESMQLVATAFLVAAGERRILIDTGYNRDDTPQVSGFGIERPHGDSQLLKNRLAGIGIKPEEIDTVVNTHLHWDHAGGNRMFPNARFYVQKEELRQAYVPDDFMIQYYFRDDFDVGVEYRLLNGDANIADGVRCIFTPGHTQGHQSVIVETDGSDVLLCGDACPVYDGWENGGLAGIHSDPLMFLDSMEMMQSLDAEPVFCHDFEWWERRGWKPWK